MSALTAMSAVVVARDLLLRWRRPPGEGGRALPVNGLVAYATSIYIWLMAMRLDPVVMLVVPFFHSLQYLCVVWRYKLNVEAEAIPRRATAAAPGPACFRRRRRPSCASRSSADAGSRGFLGGSSLSRRDCRLRRAVFGSTLFIFIGWTFINIHHYFIDSVIWRGENTETRRIMFVR